MNEKSDIIGYLCPACKTPNPASVKYCVKCGQWLLDTVNEAKPLTKNEYKKFFSEIEGEKSFFKKSVIWIEFIVFLIFFISGTANAKMWLSLLLCIVGLISIIKPLRFIGIKKRLKGLATLCIGFIFLLISGYYLSLAKPTGSIVKNIDINGFKSQSIKLTYDNLARETDKFINQKVKLTGKVIQIQEGYGNRVIIRVNVTKGQYGIYQDTVWVNYEYKQGEKRFLENDTINVWGVVKGRKSYVSVLGGKVTLPEIDGMFIEIIEKRKS